MSTESIAECSLVKVSDDLERVKKCQGDSPGWNSQMQSCLGKLGYVKRTFSVDAVHGCRVFFGKQSWSFKNDILTKLSQEDIEKLREPWMNNKTFSEGDFVQITKDLNSLEMNQDGHGGWLEEMKDIVGKIGFVKEILKSGDIRVRLGKKGKYILNRDSVKMIYSECPVKILEKDQELRVKSIRHRVKHLQIGHGDWCCQMDEILGQEVKVVKTIDRSGDVKVIFNDKIWTLNPRALLEPNEEDVEFQEGDHLKVISDLEEAKKLQVGHGGFTKGMDKILGNVGELLKILPNGDFQVFILGKSLVLNPKMVTVTQENLSIENDVSSGGSEDLFKDFLELMPEGIQRLWRENDFGRLAADLFDSTIEGAELPESSLVKVLNDEDKVKEIQGVAPGWNPAMSSCIGRIGYVKSARKLIKVAKVYFGDATWGFKTAALQALTEDEINELRSKHGEKTDFTKGDFVQTMSDVEFVKQKQENHGGWNSEMEKIVGKIGYIKMVFPDGDLIVRFGSSIKYMMNKECVKILYAIRRPKKELNISGEMKVIGSLPHLESLQKAKGDQNDLNKLVGQNVTVLEKLTNGLVKISFQGETWQVNPLALRELEDDDKLFHTGEHVKLIDDDEKVKQLQKGHGEYNPLMRPFLGKVGRVVGIFSKGDLRVQFPHQKLTLNPEALLPTDERLSTMEDMLGLSSLVEMKNKLEKEEKQEEELKNLPEEEKRLVKAIDEGKLETVKSYYADQRDINKRFGGCTTLHLAIHADKMNILDFLIKEQKATLDALDYKNRTPLLLAVEKGNFEIVKRLLEEGHMEQIIEIEDENERTPLLTAAYKGYRNISDLLLKTGVDTMARDSKGSCALHYAALRDNYELAKKLIEANPDLCHIENHKKRIPLHVAAEEGNRKLVELLIRNGSKCNSVDSVGDTPLQDAATESNNIETVKFLVKADPNVLNMQNSKGRTVLHRATYFGHLDIVKYLIANGAVDINITDSDGDTPLHYALYKEHEDIGLLLIEAKCSQISNNKKRTPLHIAAYQNKETIAKKIIDLGGDLSLKDTKGNTPLHTALRKGHSEIADYLIEKGAPLNTDNADGFLPLHVAALSGNLSAVQKMIKRQTDIIDVKKNDGFTALHLAANNGHATIAEALVEGHADPNVTNTERETALHLAVKEGYKQCVEILANNGAEINKKNASGNTALHLAVKKDDDPSSLFDMSAMFRAMFSTTESPSKKSSSSKEIALFLVSHGADLYIQNNKGRIPLEYVDDDHFKEELKSASKRPPTLPTEIRRKHRQSVHLKSKADCKLCMKSSNNIIFTCGHSVCNSCSMNLRKCPFCMMEIELRISLFA